MANRPRSRSRLYEYGNDRLPAEEGFVRMVVPLTDDLDTVSEKLFALKTKGGSEFCGQVIRDATGQLTWSRSSGVYKAIFIAGNEPFSQGSVDYHTASVAVRSRRGSSSTRSSAARTPRGYLPAGALGAVLADGRYMSIDHNQKVAAIPCPQDDEIARLGLDLNKTYIPYGRMGQEGLSRQAAQDANASTPSPACTRITFGLEKLVECVLQRHMGPDRCDQDRKVQARRPEGQ